ncbi:hypothetical protein Tco_0852990 [Tanacetum coccineum]
MPSWKHVNPLYKFKWTEKTIPVVEDAEAEAVQIILTVIDNDIYSIVDACPNACEMWKAIERLKQDGESLESYFSRFYKMMNELVRNQFDATNHQVNVQFLLQLQPEWQWFMTLVKKSQELKIVSYHKLYDILKQHQNKVNEIRAERLAPATRNRGKTIVNFPPPTYDQEPTMVAKDDKMSNEKEIDKIMALIFLSFKKIYKPTNNNLRTSSNTSRANQDNTPRINRGTGYDNQRAVNVVGARENVAKECQKPKWAKDVSYHKEKMLLCKQEEAGFQLNAEQADWKDDTDDEPDDHKLEAHYLYMAKIQEVTPDDANNSGPIFDTKEHHEQPESVNDAYLEEQGDTNFTIDSLDMSNNGETVDQDDDDLAKERDLLTSLIEKLKCVIDDNKNHNKFLESLNKTLIDKLKDLKKFQVELDRYHDVNYASKVEIDCAKAKGDLVSYKIESQKSFNEYTRKINDLNQTILEIKKELFAHHETISIMSQEKETKKKFHKTREDKELEKVIALENKIKILDDILYKTGQSIQTKNMLNCNCKTSFVKPEFLKKAQRANPRLYDIGCYNDNLALMLAPESDEMIRLAHKSRSKLSDLIKPFDYKNLNNLYNLFVPQREKSPEQRYFSKRINADLEKFYLCLKEEMVADLRYFNSLEHEVVVKCERLEKELSKSKTMSKSFEALQKHAINLELALQQCKEQIKNDKGFKENQSSVFLNKDIAISELKKLIEKMKGKSVETKFEKPSVIR